MSESLWESEAVDEAQPEEQAAEEAAELAAETVSEPAEEASALTLSEDEFSALEQRILRAVDLVKRERLARAAAEERAAKAEVQLREASPLAERLQEEVSALRDERDYVRHRVERLLSQLDALEL